VAVITFSAEAFVAQNTFLAGNGVQVVCTLRLYKNNVTPTFIKVLSDFTEANFSGYAGWDIPWVGAEYRDGTAAAVNDMPEPAVFTHDGGLVGNNIFGWYLTRYNSDDDTTMLVASMRYDDAPRAIGTAGQSITENLHLYTGMVYLSA